MKHTLSFLMVLIALHACAQKPKFPYADMEKTANAYFKAYSALDFKTMTQYMSEDGEYMDETFAAQNGGTSITLKGKAQIIEVMSQLLEQATEIKFQENKRFFSGNQAIFQGTIQVFYKGTIAGKSAEEIMRWQAEYVIVLTFKDGKIIRQNDYIDYQRSGMKLLSAEK